MKEHRFTLVVKTSQPRNAAMHAVWCAFANRKPDGCRFHLLRRNPAGGKAKRAPGARGEG